MNPLRIVVTIAAACSLAAAPQTFAQAPSGRPAQTAPASIAIPPDAGLASEALAKSSRHGEWVDITFAGGEAGKETKLKTWVVYPERSDKAPVVIVIHEIFGLSDWVRGVADQLAADGFIALAPDLLSGMGPDGGGTEALGDKVREEIRKLTPDDQGARLNAVREFALKIPSASAKSACIGFCWGGSASFNFAVRQPALNAAVVYYGTAPMSEGKPDAAALGKITCPVLGCYGADDARVTATIEPTAAAMAELKKSFSHHEYAGAGHGFLRQSEPAQRDGANLKAAQEAWAATIEFLRTNTK